MEFYHITSNEVLSKLSGACFNQCSKKTAQQMVVVVARKDFGKKGTSNIDFKNPNMVISQILNTLKEKNSLNYYQKIVPTLYFDFIGILGQ
jgi:hypothetical protein